VTDSAWLRCVLLVGLAALAAASACAQDAFEQWEAQLPADYGLTTRDWVRAVALQARATLEAGQPVSDRTLRLYGRPFPGLRWVEEADGGHVALDPDCDPAQVHVTPGGFARTLTRLLGPLIADPEYDPAILGVDRDELRRMARAIVALHVQQPHQDWDFAGGIEGFGRGPGLYYFASQYLTLRLLGEELTPEQRAYYERPLLEGVMGHQMAPRPTESVVVSRWGPAGNTAMEENMWGLDNRIPRTIYVTAAGAEGRAEAREQLNRDLINACSTWHLQECTEVVEGRPVNEWAEGSAWWADFSVANHTSPDVMYSQNAVNTACLGAAYFLDAEGALPETFMHNFDWVARRFLMPLTLWRGRIYSPNEKERTRYGEAATYFQAIRLATYLKLRYRDARAARLERDCLAFGEWSGTIQPANSYLANLLTGMQVAPGDDQALQEWLSGNALLWAHSTFAGIAINRTPRRLAVMGAENGVSDWAVIPREGDWLFSAWGRLGEGAFTRRRTAFFGGGFAGLGVKADGSRHALVALPDECTVVVMSRAGEGAEAPGAQVQVALELLSSDLNGRTHALHSTAGERVLSAEADAGAETPTPLAGPWLNADDRIGYVVLQPAQASFAHGLHTRETHGEYRIPVSWPDAADARDCCTVILADRTAAETAAYAADAAGARRIDAGPELGVAWVPAQDGSSYLVAADWSGDARRVSVQIPVGARIAPILGGWRMNEGALVGDLAPEAIAVAQIVGPDALPVAPQVRLLDPSLETVFADAEAVRLAADASAAGGVDEVRFWARQGGIVSEPRLLGSVARAPYRMTWRPGPDDRGRYAELWAEAVSGEAARESSQALVMVRAE